MIFADILNRNRQVQLQGRIGMIMLVNFALILIEKLSLLRHCKCLNLEFC